MNVEEYLFEHRYTTLTDCHNDTEKIGTSRRIKACQKHYEKKLDDLVNSGAVLIIVSEDEPQTKYYISKKALEALIRDFMRRQLVFSKEDIKILLFNTYPPVIVAEIWKYTESEEFKGVFSGNIQLQDGKMCSIYYLTKSVLKVMEIYGGTADGGQIARHFSDDVLNGKFKAKGKSVPVLDMVLSDLCKKGFITRDDLRKNVSIFILATKG